MGCKKQTTAEKGGSSWDTERLMHYRHEQQTINKRRRQCRRSWLLMTMRFLKSSSHLDGEHNVVQVPEGIDSLLGEHVVRTGGALHQHARILIVCKRANARNNKRTIKNGTNHVSAERLPPPALNTEYKRYSEGRS